jgi:hypothetical protein
MHQLVREAGRRKERAELSPCTRTQPGLLLELASRSEVGVLLRAVIGYVQSTGRDLEQGVVRREAPLADQGYPTRRIDGHDRDRARMPREIAGRTRAVGSLDRVDPELDERAPMDDAPIDDALAQVVDAVRRRVR